MGIACIATIDDAKTVACVRAYVENRDSAVRLTALQTLFRVTTKRNPIVISILSGCLQDADPDFKRAAIEALGRLAGKGDRVALSALKECRRDKSACSFAVAGAVYEAESKIRGVAPLSRVSVR